MNNVQYVAGLMFSEKQVLLAKKTRPEWQDGLWNAVGGKIERGESPALAMVREFYEETRLSNSVSLWHHVCVEMGSDYVVHFFAAFMAEPLAVPEVNDVGETLVWHDVWKLPSLSVVGNLRWIVPLAMDWRRPRNVSIDVQHADIAERASW